MKSITILKSIAKLVFIFAITSFIACKNNTQTKVTQQPLLSDYTLGEQWVWKYKGITDKGEIRSNGTDTRTIVDFKGELAMTIGKDTVLLTNIVQPEKSNTPKYKWPLEVGKTWKYEKNWTSQDGTTGKQSQDVEVLSFKEEKVAAGTFMAYTIAYKGTVSNSRGYHANTDEIWMYAPEIKNFIKMTQDQEGFSYTEELIAYSK